jgi:threonine/homoserine/homoserine lactone efflux protein
MNTSLFVQYLVEVTILMIMPGPDMLFCLACGLSGGPRVGFGAALGTATGEAVHVAASACGLAALVQTVPGVLTVLRVTGAAVLMGLGVYAIRRRGRSQLPQPSHHAYLRGLTTDLFNPKTALFSIAFLPQFIEPATGHVGLQFAVLGAVFVGLEIVVDGTVGIQAGRIARHLGRRRALDTAAGVILVALGVILALGQ